MTFTVTATKTVGGAALTGAKPYLEVFKIEAGNQVHYPPTTVQTPIEQAGGTYNVGPILFDEPGQWQIRSHFYEDCSDNPVDSPHGHAAFYVSVP